jgi:hypothetical protein
MQTIKVNKIKANLKIYSPQSIREAMTNVSQIVTSARGTGVLNVE